MDQNKLLKMSSITKKICVALLGGFLLIFLLVHASANLCIIRDDGGLWYSNFCHFFGTNYVVKVFEIILLAALLLHIVLTIWLQIGNWKSRPVRYHQASKTKTATGSKFMIWTGILILAFLVLHFFNFYFVKIGLVEGKYMVKTEALQEEMMKFNQSEKAQNAQSVFMMQNIQSEEEANAFFESLRTRTDLTAQEQDALDYINFTDALMAVMDNNPEGKFIHDISAEQRDAINACIPEADVEPDFYKIARELFMNPLYVIIYLLCFVVLWFHMRHAFESAFQTLGWNNYKYYRAIEIIAICYAWLICLMFAAVPLLIITGIA